MEKNIVIPVALQIRVDDVAWRNGAELSLYETKEQFNTYRLKRTGSQKITILYE